MKNEFSPITNGVAAVIETWETELTKLSSEIISTKYNKQKRTIKQILGHLIDSASNNHQRMVRLQYNKELVFPDYTQDNDTWIRIQDYQSYDWSDLVQLWKLYNLHIIHVIRHVDSSQLQNSWTDFEGNPVSLEQMINGYLPHLNLHMGEIRELIDQ